MARGRKLSTADKLTAASAIAGPVGLAANAIGRAIGTAIKKEKERKANVKQDQWIKNDMRAKGYGPDERGKYYHDLTAERRKKENKTKRTAMMNQARAAARRRPRPPPRSRPSGGIRY